MNPKLSWPIAIVLVVLAVADAVALMDDLHIAEFAAAANALTIVP